MAVCDDEITKNCDTCYEVSRADNDLTFVYGLTPTTQYYLWVMDKFRKVYKVLITSGADGSFTIDPSNVVYPSGMFNIYAGDFEVWLSTDADGVNVVTLTLYATTYDCILLTISSNTEIDCDPYVPNGCDPATVFDGASIATVASGGQYTCTAGGTFNMIVNQNGVQIYNEVWDADDTNCININ